MYRTGSGVLFALALASSTLVASPALAFNWACTVKDKAGNVYEGRAFGLGNTWTRNWATSSAMSKCEAAGGNSCTLAECTDLDAQYAIE